MIEKLGTLKDHFINLVKGGTTSIIFEPTDVENYYLLKLCGQNDTWKCFTISFSKSLYGR